MEKRKIYVASTLIILLFLFMIFIYFIPVNFLKFITWLGEGEIDYFAIDKTSCIVLSKFVD